jgi:hypothetical protein
MLCPFCSSKFSYLKIPVQLDKPKGVFLCPNCKKALKVSYQSIFAFGKKDIFQFTLLIAQLLSAYIVYKFVHNLIIFLILFVIIFIGMVSVLISYTEKFGKAVGANDLQDNS